MEYSLAVSARWNGFKLVYALIYSVLTLDNVVRRRRHCKCLAGGILIPHTAE